MNSIVPWNLSGGLTPKRPGLLSAKCVCTKSPVAVTNTCGKCYHWSSKKECKDQSARKMGASQLNVVGLWSWPARSVACFKPGRVSLYTRGFLWNLWKHASKGVLLILEGNISPKKFWSVPWTKEPCAGKKLMRYLVIGLSLSNLCSPKVKTLALKAPCVKCG